MTRFYPVNPVQKFFVFFLNTMTTKQTRAENLARLASQYWDALIVGGGISGAGVLREATRRGWRAALIEQRDFAWGTSSRSSKLVHGGLRYLKEGQLGLTRQDRKSVV